MNYRFFFFIVINSSNLLLQVVKKSIFLLHHHITACPKLCLHIRYIVIVYYGFIISISSSSSYIIVMICLFQQSAQKFSSAMSFCSKVMSFVSYISLQMTQMFVGILKTSPHQIKRRDLKVSVISLCRSRWVIMPT